MYYPVKQHHRSVVLLVLMFSALFLSSSNSLGAAAEQKRATINFVDLGSILDWHAEGSKAILIETVHNRWYRAEFFSSCFELPWQESVGFVTSPRGQLNEFSSIIVRGGRRCRFQKLEEIPNPSAETPDEAP